MGANQGLKFSEYQKVAWLGRSHAVSVLPSVTALVTLRSSPRVAGSAVRPFVGFGDPYFNEAQARQATRFSPVRPKAETPGGDGSELSVRKSPGTEHLSSARLEMLPRLPETADEIRNMAIAMHADLAHDVFLGRDANEEQVRTMDLSRYRTIAFATHGLVPGDLDGLTEPALALSAPEVAGAEGDGLLTTEEILALRLNADWVVLSACKTASGNGAGAEAISGLGRAFLYAGARALLVSNWPVETLSASELTGELFRRQAAKAKLTRAMALQEAMNALIDGPGFVDSRTRTPVFSYAHPMFWAAFTLVGDGS
jgi:CHAT domain-containing protein